MKRCLASGHAFESPGWCCPNCGHSPVSLQGYLAFAPALAGANEGFDSAYFARLAALEDGHFWFEARNRLVLWALQRYFPQVRSLLEIGCGTAFVLSAIRRRFPEIQLSGSEVFVEALHFARERLPGVNLFQMDARKLPFDSEFDVAGAFDVLEHIDEDRTVLEELHRAVRPGGGIILTVPQHPMLWSALDDYAFHKRRYRRAELVAKVRSAGFQVIRVTSFVSTLMPFMLLSRLRQRRYTKAFDPYAEFKIGRSFNRILKTILAAEQAVIRGGASLPAGGSLLLVARRGPE